MENDALKKRYKTWYQAYKNAIKANPQNAVYDDLFAAIDKKFPNAFRGKQAPQCIDFGCGAGETSALLEDFICQIRGDITQKERPELLATGAIPWMYGVDQRLDHLDEAQKRLNYGVVKPGNIFKQGLGLKPEEQKLFPLPESNPFVIASHVAYYDGAGKSKKPSKKLTYFLNNVQGAMGPQSIAFFTHITSPDASPDPLDKFKKKYANIIESYAPKRLEKLLDTREIASFPIEIKAALTFPRLSDEDWDTLKKAEPYQGENPPYPAESNLLEARNILEFLIHTGLEDMPETDRVHYLDEWKALLEQSDYRIPRYSEIRLVLSNKAPEKFKTAVGEIAESVKEPSVTALAVANGIAVLWRSKKYHGLINDKMGEMSEMYVGSAIKKFNIANEFGMRRKWLSSVVRPGLEGFAQTPEEAIGILGSTIRGWPFQFAGRKAAVEAEVEADIAAGKKQIIILGEGFDTLANRLAQEHPDVTFYVNDQIATQKIRREVESSDKYKAKFKSIPSNIIYFDDDLSKVSLQDAFKRLEKERKLRPNEKTIVVAEAVLFYLKKPVIDKTFQTIHDFFGDGTTLIASFLQADKESVDGNFKAAGETLFARHAHQEVYKLAHDHGAVVTAYSPAAMLKGDYGFPPPESRSDYDFRSDHPEDYYKFEFNEAEASKSIDQKSLEKAVYVQKILQSPAFQETFNNKDEREKRMEKIKKILLEGVPAKETPGGFARPPEGFNESFINGRSQRLSEAVRNRDMGKIYMTLTDERPFRQMPPPRAMEKGHILA